MSFKFATQKKSIIYSWLISYILILLIPVAISIVLYISTSRVIATEIINSNMLLIKQLQQKMESILDYTERLSIEIALEPNVAMLSNLTNPLSDNEYYTITHTTESIQNFNISNSFIKSFYIYVGNSVDKIIAPHASYSLDMFYQLEIKDTLGISFDEWIKLMNGNYRGEFLVIIKKNGSSSESSIYYIRSLPIVNHSQKKQNLIIEVDTKKFLNEIRQSGILNQGSLVVLDSSSNQILSFEKEELNKKLLYTDLEETSGIYILESNNNEYAVAYSTSKIAKWKYAAIIPADIFHKKSIFISNITIAGILISILLGSIIIYFAIIRNYNPVKALLSFISGSHEEKIGKKQNEFSLIKQAISRNNLEKDEVKQKLVQQNRLMRTSFLAGLLQGRDFEVPIEELLTTYNISFTKDEFAVMAIVIEDSFNAADIAESQISFEDRQLDEFIIKNVVEELINENNIGYMTKIDELQLCIINTDYQNPKDFDDQLRGIVLKAREFIVSNYNIKFSVVVSNLHKTVIGIPVAFNEAVEVMEYTRVLGNKEFMTYNEIIRPDKESYYYPIDKEYQMLNCIKAGDFEGIKLILDEVFERNFKDGAPSIQMARCLMFELIGTTMKGINKLVDNSKDGFLDRLNPSEDLIKCVSINQMMEHINIIMYKVCEYVKNSSKQQDFKIRDKVHEIIEWRYNDPNLDISGIAEELMLNSSYLSRIYKDQTGGGLLEYINTFRIKVAVELLKTSDCSLEEVSRKAGFSNLKTFTRAFKKYEGVTPGRYNT